MLLTQILELATMYCHLLRFLRKREQGVSMTVDNVELIRHSIPIQRYTSKVSGSIFKPKRRFIPFFTKKVLAKVVWKIDPLGLFEG